MIETLRGHEGQVALARPHSLTALPARVAVPARLDKTAYFFLNNEQLQKLKDFLGSPKRKQGAEEVHSNS